MPSRWIYVDVQALLLFAKLSPSSVCSKKNSKSPCDKAYSETGETFSEIGVGYTCFRLKVFFRFHEQMCKLELKILELTLKLYSESHVGSTYL